MGQPKENQGTSLFGGSNNTQAGNGTSTGGGLVGAANQPKPNPFGGISNTQTGNSKGTGSGLFAGSLGAKNNTQAGNATNTSSGLFGSGFSTTQPTAKPPAAFGSGFGSNNNNDSGA